MGIDGRFHAPRRLQEGDDLSTFSCGIELIDDWAHTRATAAGRNGTAVTYVSTVTDGMIAGLYTLSAYAVERASVQGGWLRHNTPERIPAILIGMLAVSHPCQGNGLGWQLLRDAIIRAQGISHRLGARALIVDPHDDSARAFYEHFGFKPVPGSDSMYLRLV